MGMYESLKDRISDAVADYIPVNLICPHCQQEIDFESVIDRDARSAVAEWDEMAERVVEVILDSLPEIIKEVLSR